MYSVPRGCPGRAIFGRGSLYPSGGGGGGVACGWRRPRTARTHAAWRLVEGHGLVDGGLPEVAALGQEWAQGAGVGGWAEVVVRDEASLVVVAEGRLGAAAWWGAGRQRTAGGAGLRQLFGGGRGGGRLAVLGGWVQAAAGAFVEHEGGGAALQARVAALAGPVTLAGLSERHVGVGVVLAQS